MLNETWRLRQALERSKIGISRKHKRVQIPGRTAPCVRVFLGNDGKISSIQDINNAEWPTWTVMEGNQSSFPVVRIQEPLYRLGSDEKAWTELGYEANGRRRHPPKNQARLDALEKILGNAQIQPLSKNSQTLWCRLRDQKAKELAECAGQNDQQLKPVASLALRFTQAVKSPGTLLKQVAKEAVGRLRQGRLEAIDFVEQLLVGKGPPDAYGRLPTMTIQVAFDVEDDGDHGPRLYSHTVRDRLVQVLPQDPSWNRGSRKTTPQEREEKEIDALTGEAAELEKK
ncbi:MAG: hypothetical protein AAB037_06565, partial [Chloroflexota bacterium]